jgi:putative peptidoglycan binding protein
MSWFLAPSLRALFAEVNRTAPRRNKRSDGSVGDTSHQARKSDHNPDRRAGGVVRAIDVTHDPGGGCDCNRLASRIRERRDPRVAYVIFNRRIMAGQGGPSPWVWRRYTGPNGHTHHMHVSIRHTRAAENDVGAWLAGGAVRLAAGPVSPVAGKPGRPRGGLRRGSRGELVKWLQRRLNRIAGPRGHGVLGGRALAVDGVFDERTEKVVKVFQAHRRLAADGVVGPKTWAKL